MQHLKDFDVELESKLEFYEKAQRYQSLELQF